VDIPPNEPDPRRWRQPAGSQQFLTGAAQTLFGDHGGGILLSGNTVISLGAGPDIRDAGGSRIALAALTTDAVTAVSNTLSLRSGPTPYFVDAILVGATAAASGNALSETVNATTCSLAVAGPMLTCGAENTTTHCIVVYGGPNADSDYTEDRDNLVLLRPREGGCDLVARNLRSSLATLIAHLFDLRSGDIGPGDFINRFAIVPRGGGQ
jgi:hypothetical protein